MEVTCIIIDDEYLLRESLAEFITQYCPGLRVLGKAEGAPEARKLLDENRVDVLFCDIRMPEEDGFAFLESIDIARYHVVFVTAYNQYALQAIKARAFDYLLKPIDVDELKKTADALIRSVNEKRGREEPGINRRDSLLQLFEEMKGFRDLPEKIALHHASGILFVDLDEILFLEGDGAYTIVHLSSEKKIVATRILSEFEGLLPENRFFRIHKSTIVNLKYVGEFSRIDGFSVVLTNGVQLSVGRRRVQDVMDKFQHFVKNI